MGSVHVIVLSEHYPPLKKKVCSSILATDEDARGNKVRQHTKFGVQEACFSFHAAPSCGKLVISYKVQDSDGSSHHRKVLPSI